MNDLIKTEPVETKLEGFIKIEEPVEIKLDDFIKLEPVEIKLEEQHQDKQVIYIDPVVQLKHDLDTIELGTAPTIYYYNLSVKRLFKSVYPTPLKAEYSLIMLKIYRNYLTTTYLNQKEFLNAHANPSDFNKLRYLFDKGKKINVIAKYYKNTNIVYAPPFLDFNLQYASLSKIKQVFKN